MSISFSAPNNDSLYLNCSNSSASTLLGLLEIEHDYCGTIRVSELPAKIKAARITLAKRPDEFASAERVHFGEGGGMIIDCAIDVHRFEFFLDRLELILEDALSKGVSVITWA